MVEECERGILIANIEIVAVGEKDDRTNFRICRRDDKSPAFHLHKVKLRPVSFNSVRFGDRTPERKPELSPLRTPISNDLRRHFDRHLLARSRKKKYGKDEERG